MDATDITRISCSTQLSVDRAKRIVEFLSSKMLPREEDSDRGGYVNR
ncbi:MAG: hypothetical protein RMJ00_05915 [Nitrososphaerota archaeon]|nr:hypothetical protein [Candidatus Bathyarchaeota archaeon]MDW8062215.1 hypothetical protein [Nitrososphaerota archaeon]